MVFGIPGDPISSTVEGATKGAVGQIGKGVAIVVGSVVVLRAINRGITGSKNLLDHCTKKHVQRGTPYLLYTKEEVRDMGMSDAFRYASKHQVGEDLSKNKRRNKGVSLQNNDDYCPRMAENLLRNIRLDAMPGKSEERNQALRDAHSKLNKARNGGFFTRTFTTWYHKRHVENITSKLDKRHKDGFVLKNFMVDSAGNVYGIPERSSTKAPRDIARHCRKVFDIEGKATSLADIGKREYESPRRADDIKREQQFDEYRDSQERDRILETERRIMAGAIKGLDEGRVEIIGAVKAFEKQRGLARSAIVNIRDKNKALIEQYKGQGMSAHADIALDGLEREVALCNEALVEIDDFEKTMKESGAMFDDFSKGLDEYRENIRALQKRRDDLQEKVHGLICDVVKDSTSLQAWLGGQNDRSLKKLSHKSFETMSKVQQNKVSVAIAESLLRGDDVLDPEHTIPKENKAIEEKAKELETVKNVLKISSKEVDRSLSKLSNITNVLDDFDIDIGTSKETRRVLKQHFEGRGERGKYWLGKRADAIGSAVKNMLTSKTLVEKGEGYTLGCFASQKPLTPEQVEQLTKNFEKNSSRKPLFGKRVTRATIEYDAHTGIVRMRALKNSSHKSFKKDFQEALNQLGDEELSRAFVDDTNSLEKTAEKWVDLDKQRKERFGEAIAEAKIEKEREGKKESMQRLKQAKADALGSAEFKEIDANIRELAGQLQQTNERLLDLGTQIDDYKDIIETLEIDAIERVLGPASPAFHLNERQVHHIQAQYPSLDVAAMAKTWRRYGELKQALQKAELTKSDLDVQSGHIESELSEKRAEAKQSQAEYERAVDGAQTVDEVSVLEGQHQYDAHHMQENLASQEQSRQDIQRNAEASHSDLVVAKQEIEQMKPRLLDFGRPISAHDQDVMVAQEEQADLAHDYVDQALQHQADAVRQRQNIKQEHAQVAGHMADKVSERRSELESQQSERARAEDAAHDELRSAAVNTSNDEYQRKSERAVEATESVAQASAEIHQLDSAQKYADHQAHQARRSEPIAQAEHVMINKNADLQKAGNRLKDKERDVLVCKKVLEYQLVKEKLEAKRIKVTEKEGQTKSKHLAKYKGDVEALTQRLHELKDEISSIIVRTEAYKGQSFDQIIRQSANVVQESFKQAKRDLAQEQKQFKAVYKEASASNKEYQKEFHKARQGDEILVAQIKGGHDDVDLAKLEKVVKDATKTSRASGHHNRIDHLERHGDFVVAVLKKDTSKAIKSIIKQADKAVRGYVKHEVSKMGDCPIDVVDQDRGIVTAGLATVGMFGVSEGAGLTNVVGLVAEGVSELGVVAVGEVAVADPLVLGVAGAAMVTTAAARWVTRVGKGGKEQQPMSHADQVGGSKVYQDFESRVADRHSDQAQAERSRD